MNITAIDLVWALARATCFLSVAALVAVLVLRGSRVAASRTRSLVWILVLLQGWLMFSLSLSLPAPWYPVDAPAARVVDDTNRPTIDILREANLPWQITNVAAPALAPPSLWEIAQRWWPVAIIAAWLAGIAFCVARSAWAYVRFVRSIPRGEVPKDEWLAEWQAVRLTSGARAIELRVTEHLGPMLCRLPKGPVVLVPRALWSSLAPTERTMILRHELLHHERRDLWKALAARILATPHWFNPLAWLAARRFEQYQEWSCDDGAAGTTEEGRVAYAKTLLAVRQERQSPSLSVLAAGSGELYERIDRQLHPLTRGESMTRKAILIGAIVILAVASVTRVELVAQTKDAKARPKKPAAGARALAPPNNPLPSDTPFNFTHGELKTEAASEKTPTPINGKGAATAPTARNKSALPTYVVEPPDILMVNVIKLIPKAPYHFEAMDVLQITVANTFEDDPIRGEYRIDPSGLVSLSPTYGKVKVIGLTAEEAEKAIDSQLKKVLSDPVVSVTLVQTAGLEAVAGEHLVNADGTIGLGSYGRVHVAGKTLADSTAAIEDQLKKSLETPKVSVDVYASNSKVYYIIVEGQGEIEGDTVFKCPITGYETVLDALAQLKQMARYSDCGIWIARPAPGGRGTDQLLPISWKDITQRGNDSTNYQILPGDRLFVSSNKPYLVVYDVSALAKRDSKSPRDLGPLIVRIKQEISPESWQEAGGAGEMAASPSLDSLAVRQTRTVHREIDAMLKALTTEAIDKYKAEHAEEGTDEGAEAIRRRRPADPADESNSAKDSGKTVNRGAPRR